MPHGVVVSGAETRIQFEPANLAVPGEMSDVNLIGTFKSWMRKHATDVVGNKGDAPTKVRTHGDTTNTLGGHPHRGY